jgi:hypothetical protein
MFISKLHMSRRTMLRGLGATIALPLLDGMVPALTAQTATAAAPIRRLGVFYVPNGMSMPYWWPKAEGPIGRRRWRRSRSSATRCCSAAGWLTKPRTW